MPDIYNQQTISLLDSQSSNLPSGIISSDPKLTENVLGLVNNIPLPSVSEVLTIDQNQELDKPENSADLLAIEPDSQLSKSYSSSLSATEKITSIDRITDDDLLIGKVENSELQGLLGGEPGDTLIGTAGSDSSVKLSPENTLLNSAELKPIKIEENQKFEGEVSSAANLQKSQVEEANSLVILEEKVELSETKAAITPNTVADEKNEKVQTEASIIETAGSDSSVKLSPEDTLPNSAELMPIKIEENQKFGGELSLAENLEKSQVEETNSPVLLEDKVESSETKAAITPNTVAADEKNEKVKTEASIPANSSVEEEIKPTLQPDEVVAVNFTERLENKSYTEEQQILSETNHKPSVTELLTTKEENLLGVEEAIAESLTDKLLELDVSSTLAENLLPKDQILPTTTSDISEESAKKPLTTPLNLTKIETKNKPIENSSSTAIAFEETPSLTTKPSENTTTDLISIPNSTGDELAETKEPLVTSSNQVSDAKNTADITAQVESKESSEDIAKKQPEWENLTSSDSSIKDDREDGIAPSIAPVKPEEVEAFKSGVFTVGASGEVGIDFLYDGGWYQGQLAIFSLEGMEKYQPGSPEFIKESAIRAASNSELGYIAIDDLAEGARFIGVLGETHYNSGEYKAVKSFKLRPGSSFGIMLIPNNRVEEVAENPMVSGSTRPLFSMTTANPNEAFHVGQIADVTGEGNTFVMEDMRADEWTDRDYNDLIFQVRGAIGKAALMDEVVAPEKDWRGADLGKALIAYAKTYVNPDFLETSDPVDPESGNPENIGEPNSNNEEIVGAIPPRSPLSDSNNTDSIPSEKTETVSPEIPPDQLLSIADAKQLIESFDIMRSLGQEIPQKLLELAEKSLANNQPFSPVVPATLSNPIDIFTGEIIPTIPVPSIPKLEILAPESNQGTQPLIGAIAPSDNQPQNWASALVEFVNTAVKSGQQNGVVNLNIDLTKTQNSGNDTGITSLTIEEKAALLYALENKVLVIVPVGDTPGKISPLAEASKEFNNIITVGAAERVNDSVAISKGFAVSPNSGSGSSLDIVAEVSNDNSSSTTVASAKVTDTIAQVWAVNPQLNYTQVIDIVKRTATDLGQPNWDNLTGAGIANTEAAVWLAKATEAQPISSVTAPITVQPLADVTLTPGQPSTNIDLDQIFAGNSLTYEIIGGSSDSVNLKLTGGQLQLTGLAQSGVKDVIIRAIDATGKSVDTKFSVTNYYLEQSSVAALNNALTDLTSAIANNPEGLIAALSSEESATALNILTGTLEKNPQLIQLLANPETLKNFGLDSNKVGTIQQLLQSPELAAEFGLNVPLGEALSNPDSTLLDSFLLNADRAVYLLPENAKQPKVGFIDFSEGNHIEKVTNAFASVNPLANYDQFNVIGGNWAEQLVKFVDRVKLAGEKHAIVNLSFDLSQSDDIGITTRYELTSVEQQAIHYARENNVLLMVASGNTGGVMSALGTASQKFDNIITVGAVNQFESKTDYSAYGKGLTLMAPGGSWQDDAHAFVGTSRATAYVSAAASLVWAANPDLSFQQVKQLLIDSAADLNAPGWDETTGFGLINLKEAIGRAQLIEPDLLEVKSIDFTPSAFSGEGRAQALARAAGDNTEEAIALLQKTQESLFEQWQILADLGNPAFTLADLYAEVKQKIAAALDEYQQVSTDAGITTAQAQQWAEALALATQHYQIEKARLQTLLQQQKELQEQLAALGQQKSALETETQQMLADIQKQIGVAESDLAKAQAKLTNPFADVDDNLQINPQPWQNAANNEQQSASNFREQANVQNAEVIRYNNAANSIVSTPRWQVIGSTSGPCGRTNQVWGWGSDPNLLKQKTQLQLQGEISRQNVQAFQQLAEQAEQQNAALTQYAQFLNDQQNLNFVNGNTNDANTVLELLKQQLSEQENVANNYQKLASLAEARRVQNQSSADWNNSQINRWQQVGTRRTGRSGNNTEPVYGWVHYPEYIAPRDQAQQLANQAAQERDVYQQLASQSQQQVTALQEQVRKLSERVQDWPVLQQGIKYEITADELRLQAEKDLLALHTPVQQQKLETLNLQILQAEEQLQKLENQKIPTQQQATDLTENRLKATQTEVEAIQTKRAEAQKDLQNFLETAGFLLPYRERLTAVQKTVEQLETEKLNVQSVMQQLANLMLQTPSDSLGQQLNYWNDHLAKINQELDWAKLQHDQLALAIADSPERLAISGLIKELETASASINPTAKIEKLKLMEGSGENFLEGFDNLPQRLASAKAEDTHTQEELDKLNREYRELGLQKANLQDNLIPGKEGEIAAKEQQIAGTESAIAQTQGTLNNLENQLTQTQDSLAQNSAEIKQQEEVITATQSEISNLQNQIVANNSEIQQQQSVAQGYQNQINQANAVVNSLEQQRQANQNAANYWNSQIGVFNEAAYLAYNPDVAYHVSMRWLQSGWQHYVTWGWREGRLPNPQAAIYRNNYQAAANSYAQQRDTAQVNAVQVTATLQPQIVANQQQIATLQQQQQSLTQEQNVLNSQLANQQSQLQQQQQKLQEITQQVNNLQSQINQTQNQLNGLNIQLGNQQQQLEDLITQLAQLNQQKSDLEQKLIEKYREIELTDQYFEQIEAEVNRLQSRLDLLNKAGVLEEKYQQNWQSWQETNQALAIATQTLLDIRKAGQPDRDRLAFLQQQLKDSQATLEQVKSLQETITDTQKSLEFTKLQLGNQTLLLQSLIDHENSFVELERYYLNLSEAHRQQIWQWNGGSYIYNAAQADAYRANLQQASFVADLRNRGWQQREETLTKINELNQKISQQETDIAQKRSELAGLGQSIPQIESKITTIQGEINTVTKGLELLQVQENKQTQIIQSATTTTQNLASQLSQTTELHSTALRQLIGFGMLASESDVDFFATQVEPQVNTHLEQLNNVGEDLGNQIDDQNQQIANWEQELANTQDDVSQQALTNLINQAKTQLGNLEDLKASNQSNANELEDLLKQATEALTPLRQKQELEIRQKLESNDGRLESLQSQLNSENAADAAIKSGTVLDHILLADQINQDLRLGVTNWTEQFLAGNQQTKELVTQQQELSNSVDELIAYINDNLAEQDGNYNRIHTDLENGITTLGVVENRADELDTAFTSTEDAIDKIKLRIEQDAKLWEEIAPIAIRYGAESQQLAEFTNLAQKLQAAKEKFDKKQPDAIAFATQEVLPIAESLIDRANGNPALATYGEKVQELLAKFNDLAAKQAASEAKAAEVRQEWEDATNYDDTPINQINFGDKLVESRRGQDNLIYVRNSTDGGKTWTQWLHTGGGTNFDSIKTAVVDNKLFQSIRGTDNQIWGRSSTDGVNWGSWFPIGGAMTTDYSMDVVGKNLVFTVRNSDNKIYSRTAVNGTQWQNWESLGSTISDIVQDVVDGKFIQSYRGFDNQIYVRQSVDGVKWETWEQIDAVIAKADWRQQYLQNLQQSDTHNLNTVTRTQYHRLYGCRKNTLT
ncbi:S8 family serine peptidase [Kamptonema animale CS-326]|uniref:S8 family serine peptidase n=1 Tax=Kamptonema animale TaxID=92934 RepID=UPI00232EDE29|nr:S8 family serine peptidase [Kamptonema animale]MDB9510379.1 S8 family serine peptidase [Kamptonema animale CS-326]